MISVEERYAKLCLLVMITNISFVNWSSYMPCYIYHSHAINVVRVCMLQNIKAHENRKQIFSKNASRENPLQHQPKPTTEPPPWSNSSNASESLQQESAWVIFFPNELQVNICHYAMTWIFLPNFHNVNKIREFGTVFPMKNLAPVVGW